MFSEKTDCNTRKESGLFPLALQFVKLGISVRLKYRIFQDSDCKTQVPDEMSEHSQVEAD